MRACELSRGPTPGSSVELVRWCIIGGGAKRNAGDVFIAMVWVQPAGDWYDPGSAATCALLSVSAFVAALVFSYTHGAHGMLLCCRGHMRFEHMCVCSVQTAWLTVFGVEGREVQHAGVCVRNIPVENFHCVNTGWYVCPCTSRTHHSHAPTVASSCTGPTPTRRPLVLRQPHLLARLTLFGNMIIVANGHATCSPNSQIHIIQSTPP
jgi:hypothetical protein